ncbi:hypothetical protein L873DRAFT_1819383 [Choiromyces venosus 120613-1]|uniref:Uncharacterized protein n=1 Tax=Choiromyces venosus 120613-1 TaxID=1336337 RepID=A0A3N4J005_9PEZI|nr:hypothetical protein L873DRAFT_1819383 [Choiromyces venosus 120613-1]
MPPPDLTPYMSQVKQANRKTTPHTIPPQVNQSNNHPSFHGGQRGPQVQQKITDH